MADSKQSISWSDSDAEESDLEEEHSNSKLDNRRCTYCFKILKCSIDIPEHIKVCAVALKSSARLVTCKNGSNKFICDICCRTFKHLRFLAEHEKRHESPGGFLCKYCNNKFCTEAEREKHTEDKHKVFKCQICKEIFETAENYIEHIKTLHNGQNREYKACNDCGRLFSSPLILKYHQDTNCGINGKFQCEQCKKTFQTKGRLKIHKLTHTGEKNFCCSYCGQKFRHFMHLQSHEFKHTGKKPYQCNVCQKSFSHRASLSTHSTTHTGLKPYLCVCCGSRFSCASNIIQHRRKRPDTCGLPEYCTKLTKACPIANLKNPSLLTAEAPIKIFKAVKVLKENETEEFKNLKKENRIKHSRRKSKKNCYECPNQEYTQNSCNVKHLRDYHKKNDNGISELLGRNLKCIICGKIYTLEKNLKKHLATHHESNVANKVISTEESLEFNSFDVENNTVFENVLEPKVQLKIKTELTSTEHCINLKNIKSELLSEDSINITTTIENGSGTEVELNINCPTSEDISTSENQLNKKEYLSDSKLSKCSLNDPLQNSDCVDKKVVVNFKTENTKISCPECVDKNFTNKSLFIRHLRGRTHNKSEEDIEKILNSFNYGKRNLKCKICGKLYTLPSYLKRHLKTHDVDSSPKQCLEKFNNFNSSTGRLATGKKIIRCYKCIDEIFYFKSVYIRHLRGRHHKKSTNDIEKILEELKENQMNDNKSNQPESEDINNDGNDVSHENSLQLESENKDSLKDHSNKSTKKKSFHCSECKSQYFSQKSEYIRHLRGRTHNKTEDEIEKLIENLNGTKPNLKCNICGKLYTIQYYLKKHLEAHDNPKETIFPDKSVHLQSNLESNYEGKKIIRCYKCTDQVFNQKCLYIRHLRGRHHNKSEQEIEKLLQMINEGNNGSTNLKCKICGKIYSIPYYLKKHLKTHGIDATHKCKFCDEYFLTQIEVLTHTQSKHKDELTCSICSKEFSDFDSLIRHNQFVHSNKEKKQFICIKCGKTTSSKIALNDHELSNCGQNPIYRCDVCGKGLSTAGILKAHMMLHTNDFPYKCSYCEKGFRFNDKLKVHLRSHTGEKPFKCPYCDKAFGHSSTLYIHVSTHTGIKRYMCTTCSDRFSCISGLKAHWRTHPTTCGTDPNRTTKPQVFMGYRKGKLVNKKDIVE